MPSRPRQPALLPASFVWLEVLRSREAQRWLIHPSKAGTSDVVCLPRALAAGSRFAPDSFHRSPGPHRSPPCCENTSLASRTEAHAAAGNAAATSAPKPLERASALLPCSARRLHLYCSTGSPRTGRPGQGRLPRKVALPRPRRDPRERLEICTRAFYSHPHLALDPPISLRHQRWSVMARQKPRFLAPKEGGLSHRVRKRSKQSQLPKKMGLETQPRESLIESQATEGKKRTIPTNARYAKSGRKRGKHSWSS